MAHEELKALYEIDKQHSDKPWEFWEADYGAGWENQLHKPFWWETVPYRRNPDAPVWPDDKEDARKWRELEAYLPTSMNSQAVVEKISQLRSPALIQGHTAEQWQTIRDGGFLCEFSDVDFSLASGPFIIGRLDEIKPWKEKRSFTGLSVGFMYCRPLRTKGVRQPWFGGACPVDGKAMVLVKSGYGPDWFKFSASTVTWGAVTEFIEL